MKSSTKKTLALVLGTAVALNATAAVVFAQTDVSGTQNVGCNNVPATLGTLENPLTFLLDNNNDGTIGAGEGGSASVVSSIQYTLATQPQFTITDTRSGTAGCGATPITLQVKVGTGSNFKNGSVALKNESNEYALLSFSKAATTCTGSSCNVSSSANNAQSNVALTAANDVLPNGSDATLPVATQSKDLARNETGFYGTLTIPAITYKLTIPPVVPSGTYTATITYDATLN